MLLRVCDFAGPFSLNDVGCGYGALLDYMARRHPDAVVDYLGSDLSPTMVALARQRSGGRFVRGGAAPRIADVAVASGIFNVVPPAAAAAWEAVVADTLTALWSSVRQGFSVNFMLPRAHPRLYTPAPDRWTPHIHALGGTAEILTGYGLAEFTLLVRRPAPPAPGPAAGP